MKPYQYIFIALLSSTFYLLPLQAQTTFETANAQYAAGNYAEAAQAYEQILTEQPSAEVYYNLGNAYFKQGELAQSILAYERSLRLNPTNKDARHNLRFAESRIIDNIEDTHAFFLSTWLRSLRNLLSEATWQWMSIALFLLFCIAALIFALTSPIALRKTGFHLAWLSLIFSIFTLCNARSLHARDANRAEAIITQGIVNAKSSPDRSGTDLFTLHEGTKVTIHEVIGSWCNIHVGNNIGWIQLSNLERI